MGMEDYIATAETLLDFNQTKLKSRAELVKPDGDLGVLFLVLVV